VVSAITRGKHWSVPLERLIADSVDLIERTLDDILASAAGVSAPAPGKVSGRGGHLSGSLSGRAHGRGVGGHRVAHAMPTADFAVSPSPERLACYSRYLRAWELALQLSQRKYIPKRELMTTIFAECPQELEWFVESGWIMAVNVKTAARLSTGPSASTGGTGGTFSGRTTSLTLPGLYVSASTPRMRVAFRVIAADPKLTAQTRRVAAAVAYRRLTSEEDTITRFMSELSSDRAAALQHLSALLGRDTSLRTTVVKEWLSLNPAGAAAGGGDAAPAAAGTDGAVVTAGAAPAARSNPPQSSLLPSSLVIGKIPAAMFEDTPPLGMTSLAATIAALQARIGALDGRLDEHRKLLREVRGAALAARAVCETPLPGTEPWVGRTLALHRLASALDLPLQPDRLLASGDDTDEEDGAGPGYAAAQMAGYRFTHIGGASTGLASAAPAGAAETVASAPGGGASSSAGNSLTPPTPRHFPSSLQIFRGNTARAVELSSTVAATMSIATVGHAGSAAGDRDDGEAGAGSVGGRASLYGRRGSEAVAVGNGSGLPSPLDAYPDPYGGSLPHDTSSPSASGTVGYGRAASDGGAADDRGVGDGDGDPEAGRGDGDAPGGVPGDARPRNPIANPYAYGGYRWWL